MIKLQKKCCLCKQSYSGWGNTAFPLSDGKCCDSCKREHVIPARLTSLREVIKNVRG